MDKTKRVPIQYITEEGKDKIEDVVTRESSLTIIFNNHELVTLLCSPTNLDYLTVGFLSYQGLVKNKEEIEKITVDDQRGVVWVETKEKKELPKELLYKPVIASGGGKEASAYSTTDTQREVKIDSQVVIAPHQVFKLMDEFQRYSQVYRATGGVHSAALCDTKSILLFNDDLGRHNAIDKIIGECILKDIPTNDGILLTTGRVPSEQLLKVARRKIPIMISLTVPTDLGVKLAADFGVNLIGSVRGKKMNVYTHEWRVTK